MSDLVTMKGSGSLIELVETRTAAECGVRRIARMVAIVGRCSEYRDNRVADILVDIAAFTFDDVGHSGKILVHERHQFRRRHFFGDRGKTRQIRKEHRYIACLAAQHRQFLGRQHLVDHLRREIQRKTAPEQSLPLVGHDKAVCGDRKH